MKTIATHLGAAWRARANLFARVIVIGFADVLLSRWGSISLLICW